MELGLAHLRSYIVQSGSGLKVGIGWAIVSNTSLALQFHIIYSFLKAVKSVAPVYTKIFA